MYYFLRQNLFEPLNIIEVVGHTEETGKYGWIDGARFEEDVPVQTLFLDPTYGTQMADFFDTTIPLMSERLVQALANAGVDNLDTYPMTLERMDTHERWANYRAVNVVGSIDAVDMQRSEVKTSPTGRLRFKSIILDEAVVAGAICFRLRRGPGLIVVHESVGDVVRRGEFSAVMLQKTQDYRGN